MKKILVGPIMYRAKCSYCDCEFEYDRSEIYNHLSLNLSLEHLSLEGFRYHDNELRVDCPNCGNMIHHDDNSKSSTEDIKGVSL